MYRLTHLVSCIEFLSLFFIPTIPHFSRHSFNCFLFTERWSTNAEKFPMLGRFGDVALFVDLPNEVRTDEVAEHFGEASAETGSGVVTCGSPNEVANDPTHGKYYIPAHELGTDWGL